MRLNKKCFSSLPWSTDSKYICAYINIQKHNSKYKDWIFIDSDHQALTTRTYITPNKQPSEFEVISIFSKIELYMPEEKFMSLKVSDDTKEALITIIIHKNKIILLPYKDNSSEWIILRSLVFTVISFIRLTKILIFLTSFQNAFGTIL